MGNSSAKGPKTEKATKDGKNGFLRFGLCEMQGWRNNMEDASISVIDEENSFCLFGILDGHGGPLISKFVACNFLKLFTHMKAYKNRDYEQALIETFLKFDDILRTEKVNALLKKFENNQLPQNYEFDMKISFNYFKDEYLLTEFQSKPISLDIAEETLISDKSSNNSTNRNLKTKDFKEFTKLKTPKAIKDQSSPFTGSSKEFFSLESNKIGVSLRKIEKENSPNFNDLVAKNMGTTANILFIKNNYLYLANVGDSMAVAFKNGEAVRLNNEHKVTLPSESSRISKSGARIINNRVEGRLNLTRAIGDLVFKNNKNLSFYEQPVTSYPEITKFKLTKDIEFIIMACDGVWDCVDVQKVCEHISFKLKSNEKISEIIAELMDQIVAKTNNTPIGTDNMSCIVIQFNNGGRVKDYS